MAEQLPNQELLRELEPTAEVLLNEHLATSRLWYPEEHFVYDPLVRHLPPNHPDYQPHDPDRVGLSEGVRSALFVNLLTEDNLPYYFRTISSTLGEESAWGAWGKRWTSEEALHSIAIRGVILARGLLDHRVVEDGRKEQMASGITPQTGTPAGTLVYTDLQELATQVSHRNTGSAAGRENPELTDVNKILALVAGDETRHNRFYHRLTMKGFEVDPSSFMIAAYQQIRHFAMPGTGIKDFEAHSRNIANANIFNGEIFRNRVLEPTLKAWDIEHLEGLNPEAELAREGLIKYVAKLDRILARQAERSASISSS